MIKLTDRVILKTYDKRIVVRPEVTHDTSILTPCENVVLLNEEGVKAWNSGEDIEPYHVLCAYPLTAMAGTIF